MSAAHAYFDRPILRELLLPMRDAQRASEEFDFAAHRDSLDEARRAFEALDELLRDRHYICGEAVSLADFLMLPILNYARLLPPAEQWFGGADALTRWLSAMESRPSFVAASGS